MLAAVDIETYDPYLKKWGSGAINKTGRILGVGIYCPDMNIEGYFDYTDETVINVLKDASITKIFHNGVYDLDWLINWAHYTVNGRIEDTMTRETLLDSYKYTYNLDYCCEIHGVAGKNKGDTIDKYWTGKGKAVENLDKIPRGIVAKYCIQDCKATYGLYKAQEPLLKEQGLEYANDIECRLYPALLSMRGNGFILDIDGRRKLSDKLNDEYEKGIRELENKYGFKEGELSLNSAAQLEKIWKQEHLPIEYTSTGRPSFTAEILSECVHPVGQQVHHLKTILKTLNTFIDGGFVDQSYNGRLYSTFYPAKRDDGGTVTGRWSSQNINLQQIPARGDKFGKEIRSLFIPEENCLLGAFDYKQIEYRVFSHFAVGEAGKIAQDNFWKAEKEGHPLDYHQMVQDMMGWSFPDDEDKMKAFRHVTKNLNFGSIYGLGPKSFAEKFKLPLLMAHPDADPDNLLPIAKALMEEYRRKIPFVTPTCNKIQEVGSTRGYVKTLSGRRQRKPLSMGPHGDTPWYKLINYLIQGSAADILKKAMVDAWELGIFNILKLHAVVHDEIVFSIPKSHEGYEACCKLRDCMVHAYDLKVPIGVDTEIGPDWGHCNEANWKAFEEEYK